MNNNRGFFVIALVLLVVINLAISWIRSDQFQHLETIYFDENSDFEHPARVSTVEEGYLVVGKNKMQSYNDRGELRWEKTLFSYNSISDSHGDTLVLADDKAGDVFVLNRNGDLLYTHRGIGRLIKAKVFDAGAVGVLTDDNRVYVYSPKLGKMLGIELPLGTIVDFDYSEDNKRLAVVLIDRTLNSYLNVCTVSGEITSGIILEKDLAYGVKADSDRIRVVSDSSVSAYDYSGTLIERTDVEGAVTRFDLRRHLIGYKADPGETVRSLDSKFFVPAEAMQVLTMGNRLLVSLPTTVQILDPGGRVVRQIDAAADSVAVHSISEESFLLEYANRIEFYKLNR
ncbi:MAG: DUF5711 family protein [Bacillota bacterium]|nr:DUF5711 family protein [Bacillota bacterium]